MFTIFFILFVLELIYGPIHVMRTSRGRQDVASVVVGLGVGIMVLLLMSASPITKSRSATIQKQFSQVAAELDAANSGRAPQKMGSNSLSKSNDVRLFFPAVAGEPVFFESYERFDDGVIQAYVAPEFRSAANVTRAMERLRFYGSGKLTVREIIPGTAVEIELVPGSTVNLQEFGMKMVLGVVREAVPEKMNG